MSPTPTQRKPAETAALDGGLRGQKRMAWRFAQAFTGQFVFTPGREWLEWTGAYWRPCDDAGPWRGVHTVCREALRELATMAAGPGRDELYADVRACDSEAGTRGVLAHARRAVGIRFRDDQLDASSHLFAFQNGTFDLAKGEFRESDPADLITLASNCDYDPAAECPMYDELMDLYQPDDEVQQYLHRLAGAAMEGRQNLQNLITWYGSTGGNGKGTTMRAWQEVFGTYSRVMPVEALLARKGQDQYRDEKARLKGVRLVLATEPSEGARFDTGTVKSLTGGDRVTARAVYKATVEFDPTWLIIMATNNRVATPDDGGMARRLKEIQWGYTIAPEAMRDDLDDILRKEASGIANRLLLGWFDYKDHGIAHPASVESATKEYLAEVDPIAQFLDECTRPQEGVLTPASVLYARYKSWCEAEGAYPKSGRVFGAAVGRRPGMERVKRSTFHWRDLAMVDH